jgi:uncharacterized protein DUF4386
MPTTSADRTQRTYARVAGILFLWLIISAIGGTFIISGIAGNGTFAETAKRIAASEHLYRIGLSLEVIEIFSAVVFAFALYVTLKPVSSLLALLAMIFYLQDIFLSGVVWVCGFVRLHLYTSSQTVSSGTALSQAMADVMRNIAGVTENIGGISFGIAMLLFFYLFLKSRYITTILSALGLLASAVWTGLYFAILVFPEQRGASLYICFPLMAVADITTAFWLMLFVVQTSGGSDPVQVATAT